MEDKIKFNYDIKKKIVDKIKKINDKKIYKKIFKIIIKNDISYTINNNGIFFNINKLSDEHISLINNLIP